MPVICITQALTIYHKIQNIQKNGTKLNGRVISTKRSNGTGSCYVMLIQCDQKIYKAFNGGYNNIYNIDDIATIYVLDNTVSTEIDL